MGSAGSKYGIVHDEIPLKGLKDNKDASLKENHLRALKDIRWLIHNFAEITKAAHADSK